MANVNLAGGANSIPVSVTTITNTQDAGLEISFINGHTTDLLQGQLVKLNSNGELVPISAATDYPLGTVSVGNIPDARVTVKTHFKQIVRVATSAAITAGNFLTSAAFDSTKNMNTVTVAASTNHCTYIALETVTAAAGTVLIAGELLTPLIKA